MCEIDCMLVERYFNQKYWVFLYNYFRYFKHQTRNIKLIKQKLVIVIGWKQECNIDINNNFMNLSQKWLI